MVSLKTLKFPVLLFMTCFSMILSSYFFIYLDKTMILELELMSISSTCFSLMIVVDKVSLSFSVIVTLIASSVFTFSYQYMEEDPFSSRFIWILMSFVISMNMLVFSGSVFFLFIGWDGLGITSFALIIYYQSYSSLSAGFQTLMINRIGDSLIVVGMFMFVLSGQFTFISLTEKFLLSGVIGLLSIAGLTKSAQFPFSSWLPAAMAAPTPVSALVHSSTLVTAGIFLIIRLSYNVPLSSEVMNMLIFCGSITCLLGGWAGTFENDVKKIIALSTLSQLGVMVFSLGLGLPSLALFHLYTHALFKALLFLAAGHILMAAFGAQDIRLLGGVGMSMPLTMVMFNISSFCLVGAPFLSAFYSKHMILEKMFMTPVNMFGVTLMVMATIMTAKYVSRMLKCVSWSKTISPIMNSTFTIYTTLPVVILACGGIMSGKIFSLLEVSNLELAYIPNSLGYLINFLTLLGLSLGLIMQNKVSWTLSSLFFLTPLVSLGSKVLSPLTKKMNNLDYGWLEPKVLMQEMPYLIGHYSTQLFNWPTSRLSLIRSIIFMFFLYFVFMFNF